MKARGGLVLLATLAVAAFIIASPFRSREHGVRPLDGTRDDATADDPHAPAAIDVPSEPPPTDVVPTPSSTTPQPLDAGPALHGMVVDSATGHPIAGAVIDASAATLEPGAITRPRRPVGAATEPRVPGPVAQSTSDATGRFSIPWSADHPSDLRIVAGGHLEEVRLSVAVEDELRISLRAGSPIRGRVHRGDGVGIEGALVRADTMPRDATERGVRVASTGRTDASGSFEVLGLPGVSSMIAVTHAEYMPASARTTPDVGPVLVAMVPALRTWIRLRAPDGGPVSAPVVQWNRTSTAGGPLGVGVVDLAIEGRDAAGDRPGGSRNQADGFGPVKVPCVPSDGVVRFTVRMVGRLPWTSEELPIPAGGGERTIDATLERDPGVGSITVRMRDPDGRDLPFQTGVAAISVRRTDGPALAPRGLERDGSIVFEGLLAGAYEVSATDRRFGAATATVIVDGGRETPSDVTLSAPAALRVRADAGPKRRVHFQLLRGGAAATAFEDPPPKAGADQDRNLTHFFAGAEGTLLRGLGVGRYTVKVLSPDLVAPEIDVELVAGTTADVEIHARPR